MQTLWPGVFRRVQGIAYTRERLTLPDSDFLDLDWVKNGQKRLVILTHGLEGNSVRTYMLGMAKVFSDAHWDVLSWNCRSCSGVMNQSFKLYHHGDTADIQSVVLHALSLGYTEISLVGFSMGANIILKYLGVNGEQVPKELKAAVAFSGPCDLEAASNALDLPQNRIYKTRFLKALGTKLAQKNAQFPGHMDMDKLKQIGPWRDFDEWFSAPLCGYQNAAEFYYQSSSKNFVAGIKVPALLVNAANDPILTPSCMPFEEARNHNYFHFQMTKTGGHCGFSQTGDSHSWAERRALDFCQNMK